MSETGWRWPRWIAHRGGGTAAPENTLAGIRLAARAGFQAVEVDVRLAADSVPVVIHDDNLARTAGRAERVADLEARELAGIRADAGFTRSSSEDAFIPTVTALLQEARVLGLRVNLEFKSDRAAPGRLPECLAATLEHQVHGDLLLSCFDPDVLGAAARWLPGLPRALLAERDGRETVNEARRLRCVALHLPSEHCSPSTVAFAHQCGLRVAVWTVNESSLARALFTLGVDSIFTDRLEFAADARD